MTKLTTHVLDIYSGKPGKGIKVDLFYIDGDEKTKLMCLSGVKQYPMRVKCATLSWHTLTSAMNNTQEEINTEKFD